MKKQKIALVFICLNLPYWQFLEQIIKDAKQHFLTNHQVDFFGWSDMPELNTPEYQAILSTAPTNEEIEREMSLLTQLPPAESRNRFNELTRISSRESLEQSITFLRSQKDITVFPTEPIEWPYPTLMRYHLFLQQEETLKEYDQIFYLDVDMRIVDTVGDEILSEGLTMAEHPMYSLRREYIPPYEPNMKSTAFIPRLGAVIINEAGQPWFKPFYAAGGFQGGTSTEFIKAMKEMRKNVDRDSNNNYIAIWNDESHWNKYLFNYTGYLKVLSPSYVYPDSLIQEYYTKVWGKNYKPIIVTLTKKFTTSKEAGDDLRNRLQSM